MVSRFAVIAGAIGLVAFTALSGAGSFAAAGASAPGTPPVPHVSVPVLKTHAPAHVNPYAAQAAAAARSGSKHVRFNVVSAHTYTVNTTSDDTLYSSAPAHTCQDTTTQSLCSYRAAISAVNADLVASAGVQDTIILPAGDYKLDPAVASGAAPTLNSGGYAGSVLIQGAGQSSTTLDASHLSFGSQLLNIADSAYDVVQVSGITFLGASTGSSDGGAIYGGDDATLEVDNCTFSSDSAPSAYGGGIYDASGGTLQVASSTFTSNTSEYGGGAIYDASYTALFMSDDTFSNNQTTDGSGGAVYADGQLQDDYSTFTSNTGDLYGGAVYADYDAILDHDTFTLNTATTEEGGAIYADYNLILTNSTVQRSSAYSDGGGVYSDDTGLFDHDTFSKNTSQDSYGGDIYNDEQMAATNSTFATSQAKYAGGSIYNDDGMTLTGDSFTGANSTSDDGGAIYNDDYAAIDQVKISGGHTDGSGEYGGGIYNDDYLTLTNSSVSGSTAGDEGGGIYNDDYMVMSGSTVTGSTAKYGGGIYNDEYLIMSNSTVSNSTATLYEGGGIYNDDYLLLTSSTLSGNVGRGGRSERRLGRWSLQRRLRGAQGGHHRREHRVPRGRDLQQQRPARHRQLDDRQQHGEQLGRWDLQLRPPGHDDTEHLVRQRPGSVRIPLGRRPGVGRLQPRLLGHMRLRLDGRPEERQRPPWSLANNGGPTKTMALGLGSAAIGKGGTGCAQTDQRGVAKAAPPTKCDIGAYYSN